MLQMLRSSGKKCSPGNLCDQLTVSLPKGTECQVKWDARGTVTAVDVSLISLEEEATFEGTAGTFGISMDICNCDCNNKDDEVDDEEKIDGEENIDIDETNNEINDEMGSDDKIVIVTDDNGFVRMNHTLRTVWYLNRLFPNMYNTFWRALFLATELPSQIIFRETRHYFFKPQHHRRSTHSTIDYETQR